MSKPAIFLDRDGVINKDTGYVSQVDDFHFLPGVIDALQLLKKKGYLLVVVTNQSGIARNYYTEDDMHALDARDFLGHPGHEGWCVRLAAVRHRCQIGAVGLDEHAVHGHEGGHGPQVGRIAESEDAGKRNAEAQVERAEEVGVVRLGRQHSRTHAYGMRHDAGNL